MVASVYAVGYYHVRTRYHGCHLSSCPHTHTHAELLKFKVVTRKNIFMEALHLNICDHT